MPAVFAAEPNLPKMPNSCYCLCMSYRTLEVEIDHGHVLAKGPEALPEKVSGLLTILNPLPLSHSRPAGLSGLQLHHPSATLNT